MIDEHRILCIIPARGGSKGVPGKNTRVLAGRPLISHTIEQALASRLIDRVICSTDDALIAQAALGAGAEVPFLRPADLASDSASTIDVLLHAMEWVRSEEGAPYDIVILLHATTPLRAVSDIDGAIMALDADTDDVVSVAPAYRNPYFNMVEMRDDGYASLVKAGAFATRQSAPVVYDLNSSIYVWWWDALVRERAVITTRTKAFVMPRERSVDIDDEMDFLIAEALISQHRGE